MDWRALGVGLRIGGHRGAAALAPENTLASFRVAADSGVDYVELDVQLTADGVAVVIHDADLERTTSGHGPVATANWEDLERLDAGAWFGTAFAGARVPTLAAVLRWIEARPPVGATIEAKGQSTGEPIARAIAASPAVTRLSICSFDPAELRAAAVVAPDVARLLIIGRDDPASDPFAAAGEAAATGVNLPWEWADRDLVRRLHDAGLFVAGGTVDDAAGVVVCLGRGIDAVDSNRPAVVVTARDDATRGTYERVSRG